MIVGLHKYNHLAIVHLKDNCIAKSLRIFSRFVTDGLGDNGLNMFLSF